MNTRPQRVIAIIQASPTLDTQSYHMDFREEFWLDYSQSEDKTHILQLFSQLLLSNVKLAPKSNAPILLSS